MSMNPGVSARPAASMVRRAAGTEPSVWMPVIRPASMLTWAG